jgi:adenylate kinase family enzyme
MKRFQSFKDNTMPVVEMFSTKHALRKVSSAQSKEAVWAETKPLFVELFSGAKK